MATISIVFDFDSTLATTFVGGEMFRGYTPEDKVAEASKRHSTKQTTLRVYQEEVFDLVEETTSQMSKRAAAKTSIRALTHEICELVWRSGGKVAVASAGLDFYIQPVLNEAGLNKIELHSGKVVSSPTDLPPFRYDYPSAGKDCQGDWVTCKCSVIERIRVDTSADESEVVFVGDGSTSDACAAANAADTVFATGRLLNYCNSNGIPATEFGEDFEPLLSYLLSKTTANGAQ